MTDAREQIADIELAVECAIEAEHRARQIGIVDDQVSAMNLIRQLRDELQELKRRSALH